METLNLLWAGLAVALQPGNLLFAGIGVLLGTLVGLPLPILFYCLFFDYLARAMQIAQ